MKTAIFIRTCAKDNAWLPYLAASIRKFATGFDLIVVQVPADQEIDCPRMGGDVLVYHGPSYGNGTNFLTGMPDDYNGQQIDKLNAAKVISRWCDAIVFVDSDCVFTRPVDVSTDPDLWVGDRPVLWHTPWEEVGPAICWREPVRGILGWDPEAETMRRFPIIHRRDTLVAFTGHLAMCGVDLLKEDRISEFNLLGNYVLSCRRDLYAPIDTRNGMPPALMRQFWSWGGITDDVKAEMRDILGEDCP